VDVFDTLLLRDTSPEPARFKKISELQAKALNQKLGLRLTSTDFYLLRREAARVAYGTRRVRNGGREATWLEIFGLMFKAMGLEHSKDALELCAAIELRFEKESLTLNTALCRQLDVALQLGKHVVCLSDMYLSSEQIRKLIDEVAGQELGVKVYSSADFGFGKGSGALFHRLAEDYAVDFSAIFHCGDNYFADFQVPHSLGIRACLLPRSMTWRFMRKAKCYYFNRRLQVL